MPHQFDSTRRVTLLLAPIILLTGLITSVTLATNDAPTGRGNGKIAFVSNRENEERIYTMNPDGSGVANSLAVRTSFNPHARQTVRRSHTWID